MISLALKAKAPGNPDLGPVGFLEHGRYQAELVGRENPWRAETFRAASNTYEFNRVLFDHLPSPSTLKNRVH